jgi:hypothetical protein
METKKYRPSRRTGLLFPRDYPACVTALTRRYYDELVMDPKRLSQTIATVRSVNPGRRRWLAATGKALAEIGWRKQDGEPLDSPQVCRLRHLILELSFDTPSNFL